MQISLIIVPLIIIILLCFFLKFLKRKKVTGVLTNVRLVQIKNLNKYHTVVQKGKNMNIYNLYNGYKLAGTLECRATGQNGELGAPRKGENFLAEVTDAALNTVSLGTPVDYEDPNFPGEIGTKIDVEVNFLAEGPNEVTLKFDPIIGDPIAEVILQFGVNNTTIATGGVFVPTLVKIVDPPQA